MRRINSRTVEFTTTVEAEAHARFNEALDDGLSICAAARRALEAGLAEPVPARYSHEFVEYLSEDTVIVTTGGQVVATPKGRRYP